MFREFISLPKQRIGQPQMFINKQRMVHGTYLEGMHNGCRVIYALSIVRNSQERFKYIDFSIKLDMYVSGMEWFPLVRFDSTGAEHSNYIENGKVVPLAKVKTTSAGPHIHINSEGTQVLEDKLDYMPSIEAPQNLEGKFAQKDKFFFRSALESVMEMCGLPLSMLRKHDDNDQYLFDFKNYLFEYDGMEV